MPRLGLVSSLTGGVPSQEAVFSDSYSIHFDGTDDYVNVPQNGTAFPDGDSSRTVSFWMKRDSGANSGSYQYPFQYGALATHKHFAVYLRLNTTDLWFSGYSNDLDTGINIDDTDWHHIVMTFDGTTVIVYKDGGTAAGGEQDSSTAGSGGDWTAMNTTLDDTWGGLMVGRRDTYNAVSVFDGLVNDVAIWDAVLTDADVASIYNSGAANDLTDSGSYDADKTGNLVGYWKYEEGSGTSAIDSSDEGNNGTLVNGAAYSTDVPS